MVQRLVSGNCESEALPVQPSYLISAPRVDGERDSLTHPPSPAYWLIGSAKPSFYLNLQTMKCFILGFCILLRVLYQVYWKNRPSQQLFKVFMHIYFDKWNFSQKTNEELQCNTKQESHEDKQCLTKTFSVTYVTYLEETTRKMFVPVTSHGVRCLHMGCPVIEVSSF
jgi:hypothetical protein